MVHKVEEYDYNGNPGATAKKDPPKPEAPKAPPAPEAKKPPEKKPKPADE